MRILFFTKLILSMVVIAVFNQAQAGIKGLITNAGEDHNNFKYTCYQESAELAYSKITQINLNFNQTTKRMISTLTLSLPDNRKVVIDPNIKPSSFVLGPFNSEPYEDSAIKNNWSAYRATLKAVSTFSNVFQPKTKIPFNESNMTSTPSEFDMNSYIYEINSIMEMITDDEPVGIMTEMKKGGTLNYDIHIMTDKKDINKGMDIINTKVYLSFSRLVSKEGTSESYRTSNVFDLKCYKDDESNQEESAAVNLATKSTSNLNSDKDTQNFEYIDNLNLINPTVLTSFLNYWLALSDIQKFELLKKVDLKIAAMDRKKVLSLGAVAAAGVWASVKMASKKLPILGLAAIATSAQSAPRTCVGPDLASNIANLSVNELQNCLYDSPKLKREFALLLKEL